LVWKPGKTQARGRSEKMDAKVNHALIIAAGRGVRFGNATHLCPKPLIEVAGVPLLCRTLLTAFEAGIDHFTVVTGYKGESLEDYICRKIPEGLRVQCVRNEKWQRPNGLSVLRAKGHLPDRFVLLMADHLFEAQILRDLVVAPLAPGHCRLAVDFHPERISDLADATKVAVRDGRVTDIGKEITNYNAIDTGIFLCTRGIFEALETAAREARLKSEREHVTPFIRNKQFYLKYNHTGIPDLSGYCAVGRDVEGVRGVVYDVVLGAIRKSRYGAGP